MGTYLYAPNTNRHSNTLIKTGLTHKLFTILQIPRFRFNNCWGASQIWEWGAVLVFVLRLSGDTMIRLTQK